MMRSNTTEKKQGGCTGKGFVKGDPRINKTGRPKAFDELRALAQVVMAEKAPKGERGETRVAYIVRRMADNPKFWIPLLEIAYGKVPQAVQVSGDDGGPLEVLIRREMIGANAKADAPD